jgi:hypothetical protein
MTSICPRREPPTAYRNILLEKRPTERIDLLWNVETAGYYDDPLPVSNT